MKDIGGLGAENDVGRHRDNVPGEPARQTELQTAM